MSPMQRAVLLSPVAETGTWLVVHAKAVQEHLSLLPSWEVMSGFHPVSEQTHATVIMYHPRAGTHSRGLPPGDGSKTAWDGSARRDTN